jgi:hypothetical protein
VGGGVGLASGVVVAVGVAVARCGRSPAMAVPAHNPINTSALRIETHVFIVENHLFVVENHLFIVVPPLIR